MNLLSRIKKLESLVEPGLPREGEPERYLRSREFLIPLFNTFLTLYSTMRPEHYEVIEADIGRGRAWHEAEERNHYPRWSELTKFFLRMLCDSLEGLYGGPLSIPPVIAQTLVDGTATARHDHECTSCFYPAPFVIGEQFCPDGGAVRWGRCPLCDGEVTYSPAPNSPSAGYFQRCKMRRHNSRGWALITRDEVMRILGLWVTRKEAIKRIMYEPEGAD